MFESKIAEMDLPYMTFADLKERPGLEVFVEGYKMPDVYVVERIGREYGFMVLSMDYTELSSRRFGAGKTKVTLIYIGERKTIDLSQRTG